MDLDMSTLKLILMYVISGGGAGAAAYKLVESVKKLAALSPEPKRYVAMVLSGAIGILVYLVFLAMGYDPAPVDPRGWIETLVSVAFLSAGLSQAIHARYKLGRGDSD